MSKNIFLVNNIQYDTKDLSDLPKSFTILIPSHIDCEIKINEFISDKISNITGFSPFGYSLINTSHSIVESEETEETEDLFEQYQKLPKRVQKVLECYDIDRPSKTIDKLEKKLTKLGYEFEYGLCYEPYNLKRTHKVAVHDKVFVEGFKYSNYGTVIRVTENFVVVNTKANHILQFSYDKVTLIF
jgi:uncharacterized lipoprotein YbaY